MKRLKCIWVCNLFFGSFSFGAQADLAIFGDVVHSMSGTAITNGVVWIQGGKISQVGREATVKIPPGVRELRARVVTPGLIDARSVVGLSGLLNQAADQEQLEKSAPMQPELRAVDAFNPRDPLVDFVRSLGVTTLHTGHAPGTLISGQTMIVKTHPASLEEAVLKPVAMIAATFGTGALSDKADKAPGTRAKAVAMIRSELLKAGEYLKKQKLTDLDKRPARDLKLEALGQLLEGTLPLLITAPQHQDILAALRLAEEFKIRLVLDSVPDASLVLAEIRRSGFPVLVHPTMWRPFRESQNLSLETAARLRDAGVLFAFQSGYESYVPKTRIVLFEAGVAAANGLGFQDALLSLTLNSARLLGVGDRIGSLDAGKDADVALFDGDPFEYTTHCVGVVVNGIVTDSGSR